MSVESEALIGVGGAARERGSDITAPWVLTCACNSGFIAFMATKICSSMLRTTLVLGVLVVWGIGTSATGGCGGSGGSGTTGGSGGSGGGDGGSGATGGGGGAVCGDGSCSMGETPTDCCQDCGCAGTQSCENGQCVDLPGCGDGTCGAGETPTNCCVDCPCTAPEVCAGNTCVAPATCGDSQCNGGENSATCCKDCGCGAGTTCSANGGCTFGDWYLVTTAWTGAPNKPRTVRGQVAFDAQNIMTITSWDDSNGGSGTNHSYAMSLTPDGAVTLLGDYGYTEGTMANSFDFMVTAGVDKTTQSLFVRKGSGLSAATLSGKYRFIAINGNAAAEYLTGADGTFMFDAQGCVDPGATTATTSSGLVVSFDKTCADVKSDGEITLPTSQKSMAGNVSVNWRGYVGMKGDIVVLTREPNNALAPGTLVLLRSTAGHTQTTLTGSYGISHLPYNNNTDSSFAVRGAIVLNGAGGITGDVVSTSTGITLGVNGTSYAVNDDGGFATTIVDSNNFTGYQAGLAGPVVNGASQVMISHSTSMQDPAGPSTTGSLLVWVRRNVNVAACGNGTCEASETKATCCKDCGCDAGQTCTNNACVTPPKCNDGVCNGTETMGTCCNDCGCAAGSSCKNGQCVTDPASCSTVPITVTNTWPTFSPWYSLCGYSILASYMEACTSQGCQSVLLGDGASVELSIPYQSSDQVTVACCWVDTNGCYGSQCDVAPNVNGESCYCIERSFQVSANTCGTIPITGCD